MAIKGTCKIVLIPAEVEEPIEERSISYTEDNEVGCVQDYAKKHFRTKKPERTEAQKNAHRESILAQVPEEQRKSISDALLDQAMGMDMVEHMALLSNATDNNFTGVTFYCDDAAAALGLPLNPRASEIARCAGKPTEVRGDIFVARVFDNEEDFKRLDFTLGEVSSSAAWVRQAVAQNEKKRQAVSANVRLQRMEEASKASRGKAQVRELSPAEAEKESGNAAFKKGEYGKALEHYSRAIELDDTLLVARNNRAMTRLKLGQWEGALQDSQAVINREPTNVKALLRMGNAREELKQPEEATAAYKKVLELEPKNKIAAARLPLLGNSA